MSDLFWLLDQALLLRLFENKSTSRSNTKEKYPMKKLIIIITTIIIANITDFGPAVCNAELGGAAPLPEIQKSTGPSLEETKKWITDKFASLPDYIRNEVHYRDEVSFDDCDMTITNISTFNNPRFRRPNELIISHLRLQEMDENKIKATKYDDYYQLTLESLGRLSVVKILTLTNVTLNDKEILARFKVKGDNVGPNGNGFYFTMSGKEIAPRRDSFYLLWVKFQEIEVAESMANAFKHAVKLCQQKAAGEKAAQPPKKKELF